MKNTFAILSENALFCVPVCFTLAGTQSRTPLNTAVFMALCGSREGQMKKERERNVEKYYEEKRIEKKKELMKKQKRRWLRRGRAGRRKGYTECSVLHAMTVLAVSCMSQQL